MKILYATDFSQDARIALATLRLLKDTYRPSIYFIYVVSSFLHKWFGTEAYEHELFQRLQSWQRELDETSEKRLFITKGNVAEGIISKANTLKADLIVLGGKTRETGRYKSGIVIDAVVRGAKQMVWIAKSSQINKILCGVDGSDHSAKTLKIVQQYAKDFNAELHIVHAYPRIDYNPLGLDEATLKKREKMFMQQQRETIDAFIDQHCEKALSKNRHYLWGNPAHVLLDVAEDQRHDLIAVGVKGHSLLHHILIGSTAERLVRHTPCSLLVVR